MFKQNRFVMPKYECPMCRKSFDSFEGASDCIKNHVIPVSIESFDDIEEFSPTTLIVNLSNGTKAIYTFQELITDENIA